MENYCVAGCQVNLKDEKQSANVRLISVGSFFARFRQIIRIKIAALSVCCSFSPFQDFKDFAAIFTGENAPHCADFIVWKNCKKCEDGFYLDGNGKCQPASEGHCGTDGRIDCRAKVAHWQSGTCEKNYCLVSTCQPGFYVAKDSCLPKDGHHCGSDGTLDCLSAPGVKFADCNNGGCFITDCEEGYSLVNNKCIEISDTACPHHGRLANCEQDFMASGWREGYCGNNGCEAKSCYNNYHLFDSRCESDDVYNCGSHGHSCLIEGISAAQCVSDEYGQPSCRITACDRRHYLDRNANSCLKLSVTHCGEDGMVDCTRNIGWGRGECIDGRCMLTKCQSGYSLDTHINGTCDCDTPVFGDSVANYFRSEETSCEYRED